MLPSFLTQPTEQLNRDEAEERFPVAFHYFADEVGDPGEYDFWVDADGGLWSFQGHRAYEWDPADGEWLSDPDNDDN